MKLNIYIGWHPFEAIYVVDAIDPNQFNYYVEMVINECSLGVEENTRRRDENARSDD